MDLQKTVGTEQFNPGAEKVPNWKTVQCGTHRKPGGNGNNQHTAAAKKIAPEELYQIDTIPPASAESSIRKQIAERNNVSESYVARSEKFMHGVEIMEQMMPGMQEKILSGQFKVRDADMHRLARADFPNRKQIVHEILQIGRAHV